MKAVIWTKYGPPDGLQLREVAKPVPRANGVLVRIFATTATTADCELRSFRGFGPIWLPLRLYVGVFAPTRITILGQELAGQIEAVGKDVTLFKEGDRVFAWTGLHLSANAEYTCLSETAMIAPMPAKCTYDEAAAVPLGGYEALHLLRQANIQRGQKVLIIGAGGTIGTYGVQLARHHWGAEVTGVDSTGKLDMLRSIGADHVLDYTKEDFTQSSQTYDVIFDAPGKSSYSRCRRLLSQDGLFISANPGWSPPIRTAAQLGTPRTEAAAEHPGSRRDDLNALKELLEAGEIKPVIDRRYPLEQTADAHRYVESGDKKGNIVITVG